MIRIIKEIFKFRALIWALVSRHLAARYRGSMLGVLWSFLNPLFLIAVYSLVFKYYIRFQEQDNYTVFMFTGLLPWIWFSSGLIEATSSISGGGSLITKAIFPSHVLPIVSVITNLIHFIFAIPLLIIAILINDMPLHATLAFLPVVVILQTLFMTGLSLGLSSLNVYYRDIQHILANMMTLLFFLCPIIYPESSIPDRFKFSLFLNPMATLVDSYHKVILEGVLPPLHSLAFLTVLSFVCCYIGSMIFNRYRDQFAEAI